MSATPQDVQAKLDTITAELAAVRAEVGQLVTPTPAPTPPPPPTPPPAPTGAVLFDGRASLMTTLYCYEKTPGDITTLTYSQVPHIWTATLFEKNDISLVADPRYGKAYQCAVKIGDKNPYNVNASADAGAGEMTISRNTGLGTTDWYALAVKVPGWNDLANLKGVWHLASVGYETIQGDQVALGMRNVNGVLTYNIEQNSGLLTKNSAGWYAGSTAYVATMMPVVYNQWREFVIGVKWETNNTGFVQVYSRLVGCAWSKVFEKLNIATYAYGTTSYGTISADMHDKTSVRDKLGLYYAASTTPTETVFLSGLTRSSDLATAQSTFPA